MGVGGDKGPCRVEDAVSGLMCAAAAQPRSTTTFRFAWVVCQVEAAPRCPA
jgi:hypothetical protein